VGLKHLWVHHGYVAQGAEAAGMSLQATGTGSGTLRWDCCSELPEDLNTDDGCICEEEGKAAEPAVATAAA